MNAGVGILVLDAGARLVKAPSPLTQGRGKKDGYEEW